MSSLYDSLVSSNGFLIGDDINAFETDLPLVFYKDGREIRHLAKIK